MSQVAEDKTQPPWSWILGMAGATVCMKGVSRGLQDGNKIQQPRLPALPWAGSRGAVFNREDPT